MLGLGAALVATSSFAGSPVQYVTGEILVGFKPGTYMAAKKAAVAKIAGTVAMEIPEINVQEVRIPTSLTAAQAIAKIKTMPGVLYAEQNAKKQKTFVPNDPQYNGQYHLPKIHAPEAWNISQGTNLVTVAVIDDGTDLNHEDLKNKLVPGYDFSDNDSDPSEEGGDNHGCHTSGLVGAETNNGKGVASMGNKVMVMPIRIFPNATDANSAAAITYAANHGCKVISMSYGAGGPSTTEKAAVDYAWGKGVLLVAAAGNSNTNAMFYPAAYPHVLSVGATDQNDQRADFSNYGSWVTVAAPGVNILSTFPGTYGLDSGTSMSCPIVAGLGGLLFSYAQPGTTNAQIRKAIEDNCDNVGSWVAKGRINAFKAVQSLDPGPGADRKYVPDAIATLYGENFAGDETSVGVADGTSYQVNSALSSLGQVATVETNIAVSGVITGLNKSQLAIVASGYRGAQTQIWIWNVNTNQYVNLGAVAVDSGAPALRSFNLPKSLTPYVSSGHMKVMLRTILPRRSVDPAQYNYQLDSLTLVIR